jgi:UDP-N-acetylglucosamine--N-acetylmuramyl-(pentapeptide) pyrophosphoryl-undecaprenol N-acetylglucosamine transferase
MVKVALTGGGTAGHVMPHIALLPQYRKLGWEVFYIGSRGIEKELATKAGLTFYTIQTGKLRRYFSVENFVDIFRLVIGVFQALFLLFRKRPDLVFSKGGFVSVPVALAAWILRIPVVSHESDLTPGLANRLIKPFCRLIFYCFPETEKYLTGVRSVAAGIPVREQLLCGNREQGARMCGFDPGRPTMLVMGGSSGAERINVALRSALPELLPTWQIIHLTGKGKGIDFKHPAYATFEYVNEGLEHIFALADLVVTRAGANSLFELKALAKSMLLIPLEIASRGDQVENAKSFVSRGWAQVLRETELSPATLIVAIEKTRVEAPAMQERLRKSGSGEGIAKVIFDYLHKVLNLK